MNYAAYELGVRCKVYYFAKKGTEAYSIAHSTVGTEIGGGKYWQNASKSTKVPTPTFSLCIG